MGYVPFAMGHYIQNTDDTTLRFLEMFKSDRFADVSLNQWLALTPPELGAGPSASEPAGHGGLAQGEASCRLMPTNSEGKAMTLPDLLRVPHECRRIGLLIVLLTLTAAWIDMLSYPSLGRVFASFMTGNLLFIGLGAVQGNSGFRYAPS